MKNKKLFWGVLAAALVFGMALAGCKQTSGGGGGGGNSGSDNGNDVFAGTWQESPETPNATKVVAANGSFKEYRIDGNREFIHGTYVCAGNTVTATYTEAVPSAVGGTGDTFVSWENLTTACKNAISGGSQTVTFTVSGNSITANGTTLTKQ